MISDTKLLTSLGLAGALVGIGKALASSKPITLREAVARAILNAGLGMCAAFATVVFPSISFPAQVGLACALSSLGTSALERMFSRVFPK